VRLYLDVNADGVNYIVAVNGQSSLAFGASASCPTFASLVNMINARRLNAKKSGFLNPTPYANPLVLNDVTIGSNQGCGTKGFTAVPGWDWATGLGTPSFPAMLELFMGLP
jgi:tripeptidyl-peptidase I